MSTEEPDDDVAALREERDALEQRAAEAEAVAEELADQLADAQRQLADDTSAEDASHLSLFDDATPADPGGSLNPDGSDRAVLPLALGAVAVVALLVGVLTLTTSGVRFFTVLAFAAAAGLGWAAYSTRVSRLSVEVVDGVVTITEGESVHTFDLANEHVKIDVQGQPGDAYWRVRFYRRALDPVDVDATMVDPATFLAQLRAVRPEL